MRNHSCRAEVRGLRDGGAGQSSSVHGIELGLQLSELSSIRSTVGRIRYQYTFNSLVIAMILRGLPSTTIRIVLAAKQNGL